MIETVLRVSWLALVRDRVALGLTFLLPIAFFSIFAAVFGAFDDPESRTVAIEVSAESWTPAAERFEALLREDRRLEVRRVAGDHGVMRGRVAQGIVPAAIVLHSERLGRPAAVGTPSVEVLVDPSNALGSQVAAAAARGALVRLELERFFPGSTAAPQDRVLVLDAVGRAGKRPAIAYFAAGIGVLFLLFAMAGRSALFLEERDSGVLTRLLASGTSIGTVLVGRWLFLTGLGAVQVTLMFLWGAVAFDLDLFTRRHIAGFAAVTLCTAAAAAAFGLFLASVCRTRAQLHGVTAVVVLVMSALGGSMFPRFLMPPSLAAAGKLTFNAWALDAYRKVFWYEAPLAGLSPELAVLLAMGGAFLAVALWAARRSARA